MALCPDVASHTVNQLDGRNLLWRSVIRYGTSKIWYGPLLTTLAVTRLQILDDVSNLMQTRMRDRLRLTATGRFPTNPRLERLGTPIDRRWLGSNECDVCVCVCVCVCVSIEPRIAGLFRLYRPSWQPQLFPITPHITDAFYRMSAESKTL